MIQAEPGLHLRVGIRAGDILLAVAKPGDSARATSSPGDLYPWNGAT